MRGYFTAYSGAGAACHPRRAAALRIVDRLTYQPGNEIAGKDEDGRPRFLPQQEYDDPRHDDTFPESPLSRRRPPTTSPAGALAQLVMATDGCATPTIVGRTESGDLAVLGVGVKGALYAGTLDPTTLAPSYTHGYAISASAVIAPTATITPSGSLVLFGVMDGPSDFGQGLVTTTMKSGLQPFLADLP